MKVFANYLVKDSLKPKRFFVNVPQYMKSNKHKPALFSIVACLFCLKSNKKKCFFFLTNGQFMFWSSVKCSNVDHLSWDMSMYFIII